MSAVVLRTLAGRAVRQGCSASLRLRDACGPWRDARSAQRGRHGLPCVHGTHACACDGRRRVDRYVSCWVSLIEKSSAKNRDVPGENLVLRCHPVDLKARSADNLELDSIFCISVNYLGGVLPGIRAGAAGRSLLSAQSAGFRRPFFCNYKKHNSFDLRAALHSINFSVCLWITLAVEGKIRSLRQAFALRPLHQQRNPECASRRYSLN